MISDNSRISQQEYCKYIIVHSFEDVKVSTHPTCLLPFILKVSRYMSIYFDIIIIKSSFDIEPNL